MRRTTAIIILIICLAALSSPTVLAERLCDHCNQPIGASAWIEVDGRAFHQEHFLCAYCSKPMGSARFFKHEDRYYDSTCFADHIAPRCDFCARPILGEAILTDSTVYHRSCYLDSVAEKCLVCNRVIEGRYREDPFGNKVCAAHADDTPECHACRRFLAGATAEGAVRYSDGRLTCGPCVKTAVTASAEARSIMEDVGRQLEALGIKVTADVELALMAEDELTKIAEDHEPDRLGVTVYHQEFINGVRSLEDFKICTLFGLPRDRFRVVLAHELMHVWLFENGPAETDPQLCEGSCNFAAYRMLQGEESADARRNMMRLEEDIDPIYGDGFRKVRAMVDEIGIKRWLDYLREHAEPPW